MRKLLKKNRVVLILFSIVIFLNLIISQTNASENVSIYIGMKRDSIRREQGIYYVKTDSSNYISIPKYVSYTNHTGSIINNKYTTLFSLKSVNKNTSPGVQDYCNSFDLKDGIKNIKGMYTTHLQKDDLYYQAMMWVLLNIEDPRDTERIEGLLKKAGTSIKEFKKVTTVNNIYYNTSLGDDTFYDLVEMVEQAAIWYYTNTTTDIHAALNNAFYYKAYETTNDMYSIADLFYNGEANNPVEKLYNYLVVGGKQSVQSGYDYRNAEKNAIKLDKTRAVVEIIDGKYIIGPYQLSGEGNVTSAVVLTQNGTDISNNIKVLDFDKKSEVKGSNLINKINYQYGMDFYISLPTNTTAKGIEIDLYSEGNDREVKGLVTSATTASITEPLVMIRESGAIYAEKDYKELIKQDFDLSVRQFITKVNDMNISDKMDRQPEIQEKDVEGLYLGTLTFSSGTTIVKRHSKEPYEVTTGDKIRLTIRAYNEGHVDARVLELTDHIPEGMEFIMPEESEINSKYGWQKTDDRTVKTSYLQSDLINHLVKTIKDTDKSNNTTQYGYILDHSDVELELRVKAVTKTTDTFLKNVVEITKASDNNFQPQTDRDSNVNNLTKEQISQYQVGTSSSGLGYEDDDDFENMVIKGRYFDFALRTYIIKVSDSELRSGDKYDREPQLAPLDGTTYAYNHSKKPISVVSGDTVTYMIKVYNEGIMDGYAKEVTVHLPEELEFINDEDNAKYGWVYDANDKTERTLRSAKLSKENDVDNVIQASDGQTIYYKELQIKLKLSNNAPISKYISLICELTATENDAGIADRDNERNVVIPKDNELQDYRGNSNNKANLEDMEYFYRGQEDDDDFEKIIIENFDLALRTFISKINNKDYFDRAPEVDTTQFGTLDENNKKITTMNYIGDKTPIKVEQNDLVEYTIRVYNEGSKDGYANAVRDIIPKGLTYLPDNDINQNNMWRMYDAEGHETGDINQMAYVESNKLSKATEDWLYANTIRNYQLGDVNDVWFSEIKIVLRVDKPNRADRVIENIVHISDDLNNEGNEVDDIDSAPGIINEGEDDQDSDFIYVKYFKLALYQRISEVILIEDGKQTIVDKNNVAEFSEILQTANETTTNTPYLRNVSISGITNNSKNITLNVNNKALGNTLIKVKYQIIIRNEGEIDGCCTEITDYIPEGMIFNQADNLKWNTSTDGRVYTRQLQTQPIKIGEQIGTEITLTMDSKYDLSHIKNTIEISKISNKSFTEDIDSIPLNKAEEDDLDESDIVFSSYKKKTEGYVYVIIASSILLVVMLVLLIRLIISKRKNKDSMKYINKR